MKLKELKEIESSLSALFSAKLPVKTMWKLRIFIKTCKEAFTDLDEARMELLKTNATKNEDGAPIQVSDTDSFGRKIMRYEISATNQVKVDEEWKKLLEEDVDLPQTKVKLDELEKAEFTNLDISNLAFLIEE